MNILSVVLQILGAISGVGVLIVGIRWLYFRLSAKKLYYAHKVYPIDEEQYLHLISFWNPTYQVITENDITKPIRVTVGTSKGKFCVLNYTDKCLTEKIKIDEYHLLMNFSSFPSKAGILISYISDRTGTWVEGEIKNKTLKEVDYTASKSLVITPIAMLAPILIPHKSLQLDANLFGFVLCGYFLWSLTVYLLECYFYHSKMPQALWKSFRGKRYWY